MMRCYFRAEVLLLGTLRYLLPPAFQLANMDLGGEILINNYCFCKKKYTFAHPINKMLVINLNQSLCLQFSS